MADREHEELGSDAVHTVDAAAGSSDSVLREGPGTRIGSYKLLEQIGEGGFGAVFLAEQLEPVQRRVALKIIKLGMDTRQVVARFEQERQALALMDHTNIARVLDAGATDSGRPYFVMDLVEGQSITAYSDKNHLPIDERLELLVQVCNAVQHAHTKGVIHRDLKPSNILVSTQDGRPTVKIIDFGIAKAASQKLTDKTLLTEHQMIIGTLQYMSPEQAEGSPDIDTRTDVYALGVVLYELLTSSTPFDAKTLREAKYSEIPRIIREVEPPKPSTRLHQSSASLSTIAAHRRTEPKRLGAVVRGELDWIVMKALEKDRTRRYESPSGLALDVRRYLEGEAVVAAPPRVSYRFRKFVRRNKGVVAAGAAVATALLVGLIAFAWQASLARKERDRAVAAESEAKKRAEELKQVSDFQAQMLSTIDPTDAGTRLMRDIRDRFSEALAKSGVPQADGAPRVSTLEKELRKVNATDAAANMIDRTILRPALDAIQKQFQDQPIVDASLRQTLASLYMRLGRYEDAQSLQQQALATRRRVLGEEHPDTLFAINATGILLHAQGRLTEAEGVFRDAIEKRTRVLGSEHTDTVESIDGLGVVLQAQGKLAEAEQYVAKELEVRRRVKGIHHADTLTAINNMGLLLQAEGKLVEAQRYFEEALEGYKRELGEEDDRTLTALSNLGFVLWAQGRNTEAEPYWKDALERRRRVLGEDHPDTLASISNMGSLLWAEGKKAEAELYFREGLEKSRRVLGDDHPTTLQLINNMGAVLLVQGKLAEAEPYLREALETRRRVLGEDHQDTLSSINNLASLLVDLKRPEESESLVADNVERARRALPEGHWLVGSLLGQHAKALLALKRFREAEASALEARTILEATVGPASERTKLTTKMLVDLYNAWHAAEPESGSGAKAAAWKVKLDALAAQASSEVE